MRKFSVKRPALWQRKPIPNGIDVSDHLGLVGLVIREMCRDTNEHDRVRSEAMVGLFYAARYWNPENGKKFSSYAMACMIGWVNGYRSREERFRNRKVLRKGKECRQRLNVFSELGEHFIRGRANVFAREEIRDDANNESFREILSRHMAKLDLRQRTVLALRYGLDDMNCYTLDECGRILRITRERVRQIEARAIRKLQGIMEDEKVTAESIGLEIAS